VQTVASSAEELSASVQEIGRQVHESSKIASQAVAEATNTSAIVEGLNKTAQHIGEVVQLIESIAGQTNQPAGVHLLKFTFFQCFSVQVGHLYPHNTHYLTGLVCEDPGQKEGPILRALRLRVRQQQGKLPRARKPTAEPSSTARSRLVGQQLGSAAQWGG
jgi:hypothetical protein